MSEGPDGKDGDSTWPREAGFDPPVGPSTEVRRRTAVGQNDPDCGETGAAGRPLKVLLVDDSVDATRMFGVVLRACGYDVRTAYDGPRALEAATGFLPDVVLLDIGLPGMDGIEVARRMRGNPALQDVVLVALTGHKLDDDPSSPGATLFDHHLLKPVDFTTTVRALLEGIADASGV